MMRENRRRMSILSKVGITAELQPVDAAKYSSFITSTWKNALLINPLALIHGCKL
jgi:hypothetical protein